MLRDVQVWNLTWGVPRQPRIGGWGHLGVFQGEKGV